MAQAASCGCARRLAGVVPGVTRSEGGLRRRENRGSSASGAPRRPGAQRNLRVRRHGREVRCRREESTALGRAGPNPRTTWARTRLRRLQTKRPPTSEAADHPPFSLSLSLSLFSIRSLEHPKRNERTTWTGRTSPPSSGTTRGPTKSECGSPPFLPCRRRAPCLTNAVPSYTTMLTPALPSPGSTSWERSFRTSYGSLCF